MFEDEGKGVLLVGDNPFHNISHLSQERARDRRKDSTRPDYAADLIVASVENGAEGFMFSVSETTLAILREIRKRREIEGLELYAIVPYAYEYVRLANRVGGFPSLAKKFAKEMVLSGGLRTIGSGLKGVITADPVAIMKAYLLYELSRVKSAVGKRGNLCSILLHEVVTDMALALDLDWIFRFYVDFTSGFGVTPGFNTCNFPVLVQSLRKWGIDLDSVIVAAPFNKVGFQMNPSKKECEKELSNMSKPILLAISILAAGYLKPSEAIDYLAGLHNVKGVAVGVSQKEHAQETFRLLRERLH